jgi:catalase
MCKDSHSTTTKKMPSGNSEVSRNIQKERSRSRSPFRTAEHQSSHKRKRSKSPKSVPLPLKARALRKDEFEENRALFALYLDMQKQKFIEDLDEREIKGRWKSFLGKW